MPCLRRAAVSLGLVLIAALPLSADEKARTVEQIAETCKKSVVVITVSGRDGKRHGLGTGFAVGEGLIATNLHVIGEARPISVETADGKKHKVTHIHATDRSLDLALLRIDTKDLPALELADSDQLKQGGGVVALGNPQGLKHSITAGVVSGQRDIDGRPMIQVAIPVEPGNSGGPLVDMFGRVQGIITLKSAVTENLGFAVPINSLKPLLKKPNPVAIERWLTIGALDTDEWKPVLGARWRQRAGRLHVEGAGDGFGGRALCLWQRPVPELPFEVAVTVKLDDESGAAGLVFCADGGDKHYGFYPSGGGLRLTRFSGPDVLSWKILFNDASPHYKLGEWNTVKVRLEKGKILCFVNGHKVHESTDDELTGGTVGLAKFRETQADFKNFRVAREITAADVPADVTERITKKVGTVPPGALKPELIDALAPDGDASLSVLRTQARQLEEQAAQLRQLAVAVHQKRIQAELHKVLQGKEADIDLLHAALLIAKLDNDEVDVAAYRQDVERIAKKITATLPKDADEKAKIAALNQYMFTDRGFHGSRSDYYNRANSYLNEVIDDREGLPITLSVLYMELGRRIGLRLFGVGLPGHFVVKTAEGQLIDVYEGGHLLSREDAEKKVLAITGQPLKEEQLTSADKKFIIVRMLHNLMGISRSERDRPGMLRYLDVIVSLAPEIGEDRWTRALLRYQSGQKAGALADLDWLLEKKPEGIDLERVQELRRVLERGEK
jgi:regulator of sirC expression with transglutaminase-like and TPR domain